MSRIREILKKPSISADPWHITNNKIDLFLPLAYFAVWFSVLALIESGLLAQAFRKLKCQVHKAKHSSM